MKNYSGLLVRLTKALASLYVFDKDILAIAVKSGLKAKDLVFLNRSKDTWQNLIADAIEKNKIGPLLKIALEDYPGNHTLLEADQKFALAFTDIETNPKIRKGAHKKALRSLLRYLENSWIGFKAQSNNRDALKARMLKRLKLPETNDIENFFPEHFQNMNQYERRIHKVIRNYTDYIKINNSHALKIIQDHPNLQLHVPKVKALERHLKIWLTKYEGVFLKDESICLLYTKMYDRMAFPKGIEKDIKKFLSK